MRARAPILPLLVALLCTVGLFAVAPPEVDAQGTPNPTGIEFDASPDHAAVFLGAPVVTRYELRFVFKGATAPVTTVDLGKPTPVAGKIRVASVPQFLTLQPKAEYTATVAAIGPGGEGVSTPTDPFGRSGPPAAPTAVVLVR